MRTTTIGLCALLLASAFTASTVTAGTLSVDELVTIATEVVREEGPEWTDTGSLLANGEWECHCYCAPFGNIMARGEMAEIPGKCDASTEGGVCSATFTAPDGSTYRDIGELSGCHNVFVISSSP